MTRTHTHTHMHACTDTSVPHTFPPTPQAQTRPSVHSHSQAHHVGPALNNICSNGYGSKAISCVLQPPLPPHNVSRFLHTGTQRAVYALRGAIFTLTVGDRAKGWRGENTEYEASQRHDWLPVLIWAGRLTNGRAATNVHRSVLKVHEILIGSWPKYLQRGARLMHHCVSATRPFHYASHLSWKAHITFTRGEKRGDERKKRREERSWRLYIEIEIMSWAKRKVYKAKRSRLNEAAVLLHLYWWSLTRFHTN